MELTLQEKRKLINLFEFLLNEEISKPLGEMNSEAVDSYIKILLHLQGKRAELSPEYIDEQVRKLFPEEEMPVIPEAVKTTKKQINKKKVWLVAACIAILVALFSIVSVANDWNVFDFLSEKFGSVHSAPVEEEQNFNGVSVIHHGKTTTHPTIEEALKAEKMDVLYPVFLPNATEIKEIILYQDAGINKLVYNFSDPVLYLAISFSTPISKSIIEDATEIKTNKSIVYYICDMPEISCTQIWFEYKGNSYMFSHTDKKLLIEIIENLEEIKNEN